MLLHFIFLVREQDLQKRKPEFEYIQKMARFYNAWIWEKFGLRYDVCCDEMVIRPRSILQRIDTHTLVNDHRQRGEDTYHFYLAHFRPMWTDCTCEGYHAENFGMIFWKPPGEEADGELFLAEKNCTAVSHEILHEMLRLSGRKRFIRDVHDVWTKHLFDNLEFEQYGDDFARTDGRPVFLTMNTAQLGLEDGLVSGN